jgi:predicted DNA-binding transcriptional regulator YafY
MMELYLMEDLMRADRLLSIMMLLQARGRLTAGQLSRELEVSERTIYRDMDALSIAGVPVYGDRGPEGGYALLESYRTTLTGLTENEVRALFMLSIPAPLAELGIDQELRTALLKLAAALPDVHRGDEMRVRRRIHLDATWWAREQEPVPHLQTVHQAVWEDHKLTIRYRQMFGTPAVLERLVDPYGLVAKGGVWHLVCARNERVRVHRISRLLDARLSDETFSRPRDFDLAAFWEAWCTQVEEDRLGCPVVVRVAPTLVEWLPTFFGGRIRAAIAQAEPPDERGWITLTLHFEGLWAARNRLLGFGRAVEVLEPEPLRLSMLDYARQIVDLYETTDTCT